MTEEEKDLIEKSYQQGREQGWKDSDEKFKEFIKKLRNKRRYDAFTRKWVIDIDDVEDLI